MQYNLSLFTDSLAPTYTMFGFILGLPGIFYLLVDMPTGAFADRFGRKRTMVLGLFGLGVSGILFYGVSGLVQLFWVLVLFGVFEGFLTVAGMASVIGVSPKGEEHQFVGGYSSMSELGYFIGPLAGGAAVAWAGGRAPFLIFGIICFIASLIAYFFIKDSDHHSESFLQSVSNIFKRDHLYVAEYKEFFSVGRLSLFVGFFMLLVGMWGEFIWALEPIFVQAIHASPLIGGVILAAFAAPSAFLYYPVGRWIDRTQKRFFSILFGLFLGGGGIILFSFVSHPLVLILLAALASVGFVFFYVAVNGIFDTFSDHHRRGYMTGVWQLFEDAGSVLGPIVGGIAADFWGLRGAFLAFGILFLLFIVWSTWERESIRRYEIS